MSNTALSNSTRDKISQFQQLARLKRENLLQSSGASSDFIPHATPTVPAPSITSDRPSVHEKPRSPPKPQNLVNPAIEALKLTPKRRASIIIQKKEPAKRKPDRLPTGKLIQVNNQKYRVEGELGSGGSCVVYKALELNSNENYGKCVALKIVDLTNACSEMKQIFRNEIQFLEKLQGSPYVIKMYDYQQVKSSLYVVLELGERNFKEQMKIYKQNGRLTEAFLRYYWSEMLACVKVIHDLNIVHADLKPANFVLVDNMLKLIDFGIAAQIVSNESTVYRKGIQGTLNYISPEAIDCRPNGDGYEIPLKSDVWSLGCILYALVYNDPPFAHIDKQEKKMAAIMHDPIKFPDKKVNPFLLDVMKKCLTRDLSRRPTVDELLQHPYLSNSCNGL